MSIAENIINIRTSIPSDVCLVAVSKYHPQEDIMKAYEAGQRCFGESKAQELIAKYENSPKDIQWHFIGHLQRNKVKYIAAFVSLIHSADSLKLLTTINNEALKHNRTIPCLLQIHIAEEDTKHGFSFKTCSELLDSNAWKELKNIQLVGVMGMATNTEDINDVRSEFKSLKEFFNLIKAKHFPTDDTFKEISMGMSHDYELAIEEGSTIVRVGSKIFGERVY